MADLGRPCSPSMDTGVGIIAALATSMEVLTSKRRAIMREVEMQQT